MDIYARPNPADYLGWVRRMSSATVNPIAPRNIPAFAYHYDGAARHADAYLRGNDNTASNHSSSINNDTNNNNNPI